MSIYQIRKHVKVHDEVPFLQADGIGAVEDTDFSQLILYVETASDGYGTDSALKNRAEKVNDFSLLKLSYCFQVVTILHRLKQRTVPKRLVMLAGLS